MRRSLVVPVAGVLVLAAGFGIFDARLQDLGLDQRSSRALVWISNMSAAYLVLAFVAGRAVARRRRGAVLAVVLGLAATILALMSFYAWQVSEYDFTPVLAETQLHHYVLGGIVSGPVFGWLGCRWGLRRSWYAAVAMVAAFLLEPYAWRAHLGFSPSPGWVWSGEQFVGVVAAAFFAVQVARYLRSGRILQRS